VLVYVAVSLTVMYTVGHKLFYTCYKQTV